MSIDEDFSHILLWWKILDSGLVLARIRKLIGYKQGFLAGLFVLFCFSFIKKHAHPQEHRRQRLVWEANTGLLTTGGKRYNLTFLKSLGQCFAFQWKGRPELIKVTFLLRTKHLALLWRLKESCSYRFLRDPNLKQHSQTNGSAFKK